MKEIKGTPKNLKGLLQNTKYTVNFYQREYRWQRRQIEELINDLTTEFLRNYLHSLRKRDDVPDYDIYFMGSIILAGRENEIIDGQQRLSSLTLLLMYLRNCLIKRNEYHPTVEQIIYSEAFGKKSFNIDVPERQACMDAIFKDNLDKFDMTDASESVKNLCDAYGIIKDSFPNKDIDDEALLHFCDWLIEKVFFVEIVAQEESDASKIFITMNDRGLSLTPVEMLKSYLLSEIKSGTAREKFNKRWKMTIDLLKRNDDKGDEIFIKAWLRAQYADIQFVKEELSEISLFEDESIARGHEDFSDFSQIAGEFHKWVRDNHKRLNLNVAADYERFIEAFAYFANVYHKIRDAEKNFATETKYIYYNAQLNFTLQPLFLMAPIRFKDDDATVSQKINLAARFIDLWINARVAMRKSLQYKTIQNYIFKVAKDIRGCSVEDLKVKLQTHYDTLDYHAETAVLELNLNKSNKRYIKNILARITSFIEEQTSGMPHYVEYMTTTEDPYEIEHILCNNFKQYRDEFSDDFDEWRNRIGALLLLRKSINSSLNDSDYDKKLIKYCSTDGNIFAASLGKQTYQNNPRFRNFIATNNLSFEPFDKFGKAEIEKRTLLVVEFVNLIWNAEEFQ